MSVGDLSVDIAALAEPLACVVHGMDVLQLRPAADVQVVGAGPTGQMLSKALVRGGASRVVIAAPTDAKLRVAAENGVPLPPSRTASDGTLRAGRTFSSAFLAPT